MTLSHKLCKSENRDSPQFSQFFKKTYVQYYTRKRFHLRRFFKQFTTGKELNDFLALIQMWVIETMLEGELDGHLGYNKNEQTNNDTPVMATVKEDQNAIRRILNQDA